MKKAEINNLKCWIEEIDEFNETKGNGTTRNVFSDMEVKAREYIKREMKAIGLQVSEDAIGNIFGVLPGSDRTLSPVWTGSHIDTVQNGGKYDGLAGVFSGLEALRLIRESGIPVKRDLSVNVYTGEEMTCYGACCIGSRSLVGKMNVEKLKQSRKQDGESLYQRLEKLGYDMNLFDHVRKSKDSVYASVELHIEQNDKLEQNNIPIGVVTGICAPTNMIVHVEGIQSHAGGTSMSDRKDAYMAAADLSLSLERLARESQSLYITATVGQMRLEPNAMNVIPGKVDFSIDIRSVSMKDKNKLMTLLEVECERIEKERGAAISFQLLNHDKPLMCDEHLQTVIKEECKKLNLNYMELISGAYHDSLFIGEICKMAMIFIPCKDGISHSKEEFAKYSDIAKGTNLLAATLLKLGNE